MAETWHVNSLTARAFILAVFLLGPLVLHHLEDAESPATPRDRERARHANGARKERTTSEAMHMTSEVASQWSAKTQKRMMNPPLMSN